LRQNIRRATRKHHSSEEKIRIVLEGLRGEDSIAALCRREGIAESLYYSWSKEFLEAGKKRLAGDTARQPPAMKSRICVVSRDAEGGGGRPHPGEPPAQKKHDRGWGRRRMRYPASEKLEIIRLVEHRICRPSRRSTSSAFPTTFYRWYDRYPTHGLSRDWRTAPARRHGVEPHS
jgi:transposase-like protein